MAAPLTRTVLILTGTHPNGLFRPHWSMAVDTVCKMAAQRTRAPNTAETIHAALGAEHPRLHAARAAVFPGVRPTPGIGNPPAESFRGYPFTAYCVSFGEA